MATIDDLERDLDVLLLARRKALADARDAVVMAATFDDALDAIDALIAAASRHYAIGRDGNGQADAG